eukprot:16119-Eustigmatos_ZCMA.PRE.1
MTQVTRPNHCRQSEHIRLRVSHIIQCISKQPVPVSAGNKLAPTAIAVNAADNGTASVIKCVGLSVGRKGGRGDS